MSLQILKQRKKYYQKNKEKILKQRKEYRLKNPEVLKIWRFKNPEKQKQFYKKYYLKNKEKRDKQSKEYHLKNRKKVSKQQREYKKKWYQKNPEKRLESNIKQLTKIGKQLKLPYKEYVWALRLWNEVVKKQQGKKCVICGSTYKLNIHHIFHKKLHPELSLNFNNGVPLCFIHHQEVHGNSNILVKN